VNLERAHCLIREYDVSVVLARCDGVFAKLWLRLNTMLNCRVA